MIRMDISTLFFVTMGVSAFLVIFSLVAAILVTWLLQDIRMELRTLNDNNNKP
jgi:hypothetical protein